MSLLFLCLRSFKAVMMWEKVLPDCVWEERLSLSSTVKWDFPIFSEVPQWEHEQLEAMCHAWNAGQGGWQGRWPTPALLFSWQPMCHISSFFSIYSCGWGRYFGDNIRRDCECSCHCLADCQHSPEERKQEMVFCTFYMCLILCEIDRVAQTKEKVSV